LYNFDTLTGQANLKCKLAIIKSDKYNFKLHKDLKFVFNVRDTVIKKWTIGNEGLVTAEHIKLPNKIASFAWDRAKNRIQFLYSGDSVITQFDETFTNILFSYTSDVGLKSFDITDDGKYFVCATIEKTLILYRRNGEELFRLDGFKEALSQVRFSPDNREVWAALYDNTLIHVPVDIKHIEREVANLKSKHIYRLSASEKKRLGID